MVPVKVMIYLDEILQIYQGGAFSNVNRALDIKLKVDRSVVRALINDALQLILKQRSMHHIKSCDAFGLNSSEADLGPLI